MVLRANYLIRSPGDSFPDQGSCLFLSSDHRTGKSTFLLQDLIPAMNARGIKTIYVDLWSATNIDSALLIAEAIQQALSDAGLPPDVIRIGEGGVTIPAAFEELSVKTGCQIALLIDEAQHAFTSENGINTMFALKSARDTMNLQAGGKRKLLLVFAGSNRDELAVLVQSRQPFFGSQLTEFSLLGREFTEAYTVLANEQFANDKKLNEDDVFHVFNDVGGRTELLQSIISEMERNEIHL